MGIIARFLSVGGAATLLQYLILMAGAQAGLRPIWLVSGAAFLASAVFNFLATRSFTFRSKEPLAQSASRFAAMVAVGLVLNSLVVGVLTAWGMHYLPAQIAATVVVLVWNYFAASNWVFSDVREARTGSSTRPATSNPSSSTVSHTPPGPIQLVSRLTPPTTIGSTLAMTPSIHATPLRTEPGSNRSTGSEGSSPRCRYSVVVPCYNEAEGLPEFCRRTRTACENLAGDDFEIVLVDDGSRDGTWQAIEAAVAADPHVVGVKLMRNHGHQLAATAGLAVCRGERVLLIDADLQDPPELIADMAALMDQGADVVYGKRSSRDGETRFKIATAALFYRLLAKLTDVKIPLDTGDFRLMNRRVVDALNSMRERQRFLRGMVSWIGGKQVPLEYERKSRFAGSTKYPLGKMILFALDAFTSFSIQPLRLAFLFGLVVTSLATLLLVYTLVQWWTGNTIAGWASVMSAVSLFAGAQLLVLGVIGEYLGRLVQETKGRPLFLIESIVETPRPARTTGPAGTTTNKHSNVDIPTSDRHLV